jgi:hypothetical protein
VFLPFTTLLFPATGDNAAVANARARMEAAHKVYDGMLSRLSVDPGFPVDPDRFYRWSRRWLEAERELSAKKEDQITAVEQHLDRVKKVEALVKRLAAGNLLSPVDVTAAEYYRLEAEQWLAQAKGK